MYIHLKELYTRNRMYQDQETTSEKIPTGSETNQKSSQIQGFTCFSTDRYLSAREISHEHTW